MGETKVIVFNYTIEFKFYWFKDIKGNLGTQSVYQLCALIKVHIHICAKQFTMEFTPVVVQSVKICCEPVLIPWYVVM